MKISKSQIQKIKIAQKQLGIDDATYRKELEHFVVDAKTDKRASSCTQLTSAQADELLNNFKKNGWKPKRASKKKKYSQFDNRMGNRATGAQMRMIEAMWMEKAREKDETAMNNFILKMTKKSHITFISKNDVKILKNAIQNF